MITGVVQSGEGRIRITVKGSRVRMKEVEAVIDTGYTESMTLSPTLVAELGLRWHSSHQAELGDGSICVFDVYKAKVVWDGKVRSILVDEADTDPLVGIALLRGFELKMQIRSRGRITIKRLP